MLMSDVVLYQIAQTYAMQLRREARAEHHLRRARRAAYLEACCGACCDDGASDPCGGPGCCTDGCCADEPCDEGAGDAVGALWRPVARLGAIQRAWQRALRPRAPRHA